MTDTNEAIGYIVGGSLKESLFVRLTVPADQVQEGGFVTIQSGQWQFYGLVTDIQLGATDPRFADEHSETRLPAERLVLREWRDEDLVAFADLNADPRVRRYRVETENFESIHNHSAYAMIEGPSTPRG